MWPASRAGSSSDESRLTHPSGRSPAAAHCRSVVVLPYPAGAASTITGASSATASRRASSRPRRTRPRRSGGAFARTVRWSSWPRAAARPSDTCTRSPVPRPPAPGRVPQRPHRRLGRASTINYSTAPARGRATYFKKTLSLRLLCQNAIVVGLVRRVAVLVTLCTVRDQVSPRPADEDTHLTSTQSSCRAGIDVRGRRDTMGGDTSDAKQRLTQHQPAASGRLMLSKLDPPEAGRSGRGPAEADRPAGLGRTGTDHAGHRAGRGREDHAAADLANRRPGTGGAGVGQPRRGRPRSRHVLVVRGGRRSAGSGSRCRTGRGPTRTGHRSTGWPPRSTAGPSRSCSSSTTPTCSPAPGCRRSSTSSPGTPGRRSGWSWPPAATRRCTGSGTGWTARSPTSARRTSRPPRPRPARSSPCTASRPRTSACGRCCAARRAGWPASR